MKLPFQPGTGRGHPPTQGAADSIASPEFFAPFCGSVDGEVFRGFAPITRDVVESDVARYRRRWDFYPVELYGRGERLLRGEFGALIDFASGAFIYRLVVKE